MQTSDAVVTFQVVFRLCTSPQFLVLCTVGDVPTPRVQLRSPCCASVLSVPELPSSTFVGCLLALCGAASWLDTASNLGRHQRQRQRRHPPALPLFQDTALQDLIIMSLNVLAIGSSRNIGYYSSIRLLNSGATVTFLLRSPGVFDADETIQKYIKAGKAHLVKGDALVKEDVQRVWDEAGKHGPVDVLLFTVGGTPKFSFTKGFVIDPANLVTQSLFNALCTIPTSEPQPRVITISSTGLTRTSHAKLPLPLKPFYGHFLALPHKDKVGAERLVAHCAGWSWNTKDDGEPEDDIMGAKGDEWKKREGLPAEGSLKRALVIRPAFLTDGECKAEDEKEKKKGKPGYRVSEGELGGWTVSRKDVAHFVADAILNRWSEFENKRVNIAH
ncbi:unnamed protein product [Cyclocybe aegerita]|uniref:NAD(P)-binding domain-containing protein n=1 Tax=Cyclocybe aegerita TaxID=1973307 RepID=A0A8S0WTK4_CYCAE|nr:unnamed protein product [Cyclocybe aegerita]